MAKQFIKPKWLFVTKLKTAYPQAEIFLVGGAVRDTFLKRPIKDYDFVISQVPIEKLIRFLEKEGSINLVGKRFGVLKFKPKNSKHTLDIALPRKEFSLGFTGGYKDFDVQSDHNLPIQVDLARRDFTINAMAYDLINHQLTDPFLGQKDLKEKTIRTVGAAVSRFQEDYSRMLRSIRFACQLDFKLSQKTTKAITKLGYHLNDTISENWIVSRETISQEFLKAFDAAPNKCLDLLDSFGLLELLLPEVKALQKCKQSPPYHLEGSAYNHIALALKSVNSPEFKKHFPDKPNLLTKLGILFHDLGKPQTSNQDKKGIHFYGHAKTGARLTKDVCQRLHLGSTPYFPFACEKLVWLVKNHLFSIDFQHQKIKATTLEELFFSKKMPSQNLLQVMLLDQLASKTAKTLDSTKAFKKLWQILQKLAPKGTLPLPLITGQDVMTWCNLKAGPQIKVILLDLREEQLQKRVTTRDQAKKYVIKKHGN